MYLFLNINSLSSVYRFSTQFFFSTHGTCQNLCSGIIIFAVFALANNIHITLELKVGFQIIVCWKFQLAIHCSFQIAMILVVLKCIYCLV